MADSYFSNNTAAPSGGLWQSFVSWWNKPWGSTIGEAETNIISGITQPLIPVLVLVIVGGVVAIKIIGEVKK